MESPHPCRLFVSWVGDDRVVYITDQRSDTRMVLRNMTNHQQMLTVEWDGVMWNTEENRVQLYQGTTLTGISSIDVTILSFLPDTTLTVVCSCDRYTRGLLGTSRLWEDKIQLLYRGFPFLTTFKRGYRELYHELIQHTVSTTIFAHDANVENNAISSWACNNKHKEVFPWLVEERKIVVDYCFANNLCAMGLYDMLRSVMATGTYPSSCGVSLLAENGQLSILKIIHEKRGGIGIDAIDRAVLAGHLDIMLWGMEYPLSYNIHRPLIHLACGHQLEIVKWVYHKHGLPTIQRARCMIIGGGNLEVLKWIQEQGELLFEDGDFGSAVVNDYLSILQWGKDNNYYTPSDEDTSFAVSQGAVNTTRWLLSLGFTPSREVVNQALTGGRTEVLDVLAAVGHYPEKYVARNVVSTSLVHEGDSPLDAVKWVAKTFNIPVSLSYAVVGRHRDVIMWAAEKGQFLSATDVRLVVHDDDVQMIRWIYCKYPHYTLTIDDVNYALFMKSKHTLRFLSKIGITPTR